METRQTQTACKRRTIFIKKGLQYRYMALIFFSVIVGFLIIGLEVSWNLSRILGERPMLVQPFMDEISAVLPVSFLKIVIYLIIVLIVSGVISHKMAGPIYKFERSANIVASGDLTHRVYLRQGDQLLELQCEFNSMLSSLQDKVKSDRQAAERLASGLRALAEGTADQKLKERFSAMAEEAAAITGGFKA